jgi:hypothetical protein
MENDGDNTNGGLLSDLERLQAALTKRQMDPHFPPLILERVHITEEPTEVTPVTEDSEPSAFADDFEDNAFDDLDSFPVLEDVVDDLSIPKEESFPAPNPFLSSKALETLLAKRSAAEAQASRSIQPPVVHAGRATTTAAMTDPASEQDPIMTQLLAELPAMIEAAVAHYVPIIERDIRREIANRTRALTTSQDTPEND